MKECAFRFVDDEDIVTKIPLPPGYSHVGTEYFFDNKVFYLKAKIFELVA